MTEDHPTGTWSGHAGPVVQHYLDDLVASAGDVLGAGLVGAYAAGSVALGAYQPGRSDVDVALVCADPLDPAVARRLVARLRHESLPCPARGLELVVYRREVARRGAPEPGFEVELNTGAAVPFRATYDPADRPAADGSFWYGLDRSILHQSGWALLGPPAAATFTDLTPADLRRLLVDALRWWLDRPVPPGDGPAPGAEDAVLGACRAWVRLRHGVWLDKAAAGRRVLADAAAARSPGSATRPGHHPLVDDATVGVVARSVAARSGGVPPSGPQARALQRRVLAELGAGH
ncbi:hypothetical protein GA0070616_1069 [Micromonospora nigra]|uniref:Nucleotidyltransferase domain-containing protein n=1 Tax=Micromonospora nigra TaxID=145857 RepID=A0A1C6RHJ5_9ACTN|nr:nucleotidyltransferase domain-containing protein [Micromonospora nigra]SCL16631.1 hypothetical protein GA0070616_1069 [Micromonospora nigra]